MDAPISYNRRRMKLKAGRVLSYSVFYEQTPEGGYVAFVPALPGSTRTGRGVAILF
jgi:hypothetical protein